MKLKWILAIGVVSSLLLAERVLAQGCGNGRETGVAGGEQDGDFDDGDPVNIYTGNEFRQIDDLKMWGGVGQHHLTWTRFANS